MPAEPTTATEAFQRGISQAQLGHWWQAAEHFEQACCLQPNQLAPWVNLAIALERSGQHQACDERLAEALARHPNEPALLLHAGQRALACDQLTAAEAHLRFALQHQPHLSGARQLLAVCLLEQQRPQEALLELDALLAAEPQNPQTLYNRALSLKACADLQGALDQFNQLAERYPDWPGLDTNRGALLLQLGRWSKGWPLYEARFRDTPEICVALDLPRYRPEAGRVPQLLLVAEQGLGDSLQFLRYGPLLRDRGHTLLLAVQPPLLELAQRSGLYDAVLPLPALQTTEHQTRLAAQGCRWLPLLSAAALAGAGQPQTPQPATLPHDPQAHALWGARLGPRQKRRRIGLVWQGNPTAERGQQRGRSLPLSALQPLLQDPDVEWVSLQKGPGSEQLDALGLRQAFHPAQALIDPEWAFSAIAAILSHCDLLLSTDTAITHLAGAYGIPSLLLLKAVPDWRWGIEGNHSPWYPHHRLFRQHQGESWDQTIGRLAASGLLHNPATSR